MLAIKLQASTSGMALRNLQPRSVQSSKVIIRTHNPGQKMIRNSFWRGPLPAKISHSDMKVKSSPRVQSTPQRARDDISSGKKSSKEDPSLLQMIGAILFLLVAWIIFEAMGVFIHEMLGMNAPASEQKLVLRDAVDLMGKENAEWLDWYVREGAGEKKEREESKR